MGSTISAISAASPVPAPAQAKPANLDGDLAKCESDLSDWVHCASAKTPQGKAKIAEITTKIEGIKLRMQQAEQARAEVQKAHPAHAHEASDKTSALAPKRNVLSPSGGFLNAQA